MVIIDADVIIELLRKNPSVKSFILSKVGNQNIFLSCITLAEIQQGARNKGDLQYINKLLRQYIAVPINYSISDIFRKLLERYILSHDSKIPDTLVASTGLHYNLLLSSIIKNKFKLIPGLSLVKHNIVPLDGKTL